MIHAEVDLPVDIYKDVERIAKASNKLPAQVMRSLITEAVEAKRGPAKPGQRLDRLVGLRFHGPKDLAQNIDHYLYDS